MLSEAQYMELMRLASEEGLLVTGHIPLSMDLFSAVKAGLNGIEHLRNMEMSIATNSRELLKERLSILENPDSLSGAELRSSLHAKQRMDAIQMIDSTLLSQAAELLAQNSVWQTPTLALYNNFATREFLAENQMAELEKLPSELTEQWRAAMEPMLSIAIDPNADIAVYSRWMKKMVQYLHTNNVPFMAGTDTPIGYLIPGQSLHKELELLVESGFSNEQALQTATINPATFLGVEGEKGRIKVGYHADLVLLKGNPLKNISLTQQIHAVIKEGAFWSISELDSMLVR
jgi:imidazolonepropionase-like amidohydrolase